MGRHALLLDVQLHLPNAQSLKAKRSVVQSIVRTLDGWTGVGAAEVEHQELWQRCGLAISVVGSSVGHVTARGEEIERHVWARTGVDVLDIAWIWLDE